MRGLFGLVLTVAVVFGLWSGAEGGGEKEVTIKGEMTCAVCGLKMKGLDMCTAVIVEKKDGKDIVYFFDAESQKKYHHEFCAKAKGGSVIGIVSEKDGKKTIKIKEVKYAEK